MPPVEDVHPHLGGGEVEHAVEPGALQVWEANAEAIRESIEKAGISGKQIKAVGLTGYGNGLCLVDGKGEPTCSCIVSTDNRAADYCRRFAENGAERAIYPMTCQSGCCTLDRLADCGEKEITVRELMELGELLKEVSDAYVCVGPLTQSREGARVTVTAQINVTVLYRTAEGEAGSLTRPLQAVCVLDLPEGAVCACRCVCTAPVFAAAAAGGLEVRLPVSFQYVAYAPQAAAGITAAAIDETAPLDHAGRPSIVLRMVGAGERLWDIAKSYGTTSADIVQANALEEGGPVSGQLLLIPRKR